MSGSIVRSRRVATLSILSFLAFAPAASAEEIQGSGWGEDDASRIVGGKKVESCDFPTTFFVKASSSKGASVCTASLVHPQVVMTAAHCLSEKVEVAAGDGYLGDAKKTLTWYPVERCVKHPDWNGNTSSGRGKDFAYCKLKSPVKEVKPVPILMGCELDHLKKGAPITLVGFGNTSIGGKDAGSWKHAIDSKVVAFSQYNEVQVGARGAGSLRGDSGGPAYIKLPESKFKKDAGWRVFGVTSVSAGTGGPDGRAMYGQIHRFVEFVEKSSGIDITPCTDAKGNWAPTEACKEAPLDPRAASGDWVKGCEPQPYGGYIASCGEPFKKADEEAPEVEITSPKNKKTFKPGTEEVEVEVEASDDGGVASVKLSVNGKAQKEDKEAPYEWTLEELKPGKYKLDAVAVDEAGNEGEAKTVTFTIEEEEEKPDPSQEESEEDTGEDSKETDDSGEETDSGEEDTSGKDEGAKKKDSGKSDETEESEDDDESKKPDKGLDLKKPGGCDVRASDSGWAFGLLGLPLLYWTRRRRNS